MDFLKVLGCFLAFIGSVFFLFLRLTASKLARRKKETAIPAPSPFHSVFGHLPFVDPIVPDRTFYKWALEHGSLVAFWIPFISPTWLAVIPTDPHIIRRVVLEKNYPKSTTYSIIRSAIGPGLVAIEGEEWKRKRKMLNPAFHHSNLKNLFGVMADKAQSLVDKLSALAPNQSVEVDGEFTKLTMDVIAVTTFGPEQYAGGYKNHRLYPQFADALEYCIKDAALRSANPLRRLIYNPKFAKSRRIVNTLLKDMIKERRAQIARDPDSIRDRSDILSFLLSPINNNNESSGEEAQTLPDDSIIAELNTFMFAGQDTTAHLLSWALYFIQNDKTVERKLQEEVDSVLGDRDVPTFQDLSQMKYLYRVLKESLRMVPTAPGTARRLTEDENFNGHFVPKNTLIFISSYVMHHHPKFWKDPERFDPDLHFGDSSFTEGGDLNGGVDAESQSSKSPIGAEINNSENSDQSKLAYEEVPETLKFFPFLYGPRNCIGQNFGMLEARIVLAMLVKKFHWRVAFCQDIAVHAQITLRPARGMNLTFHKRK